MGNFLGPEETDDNCREADITGQWIEVSLYMFLLKLTLLHFIYSNLNPLEVNFVSK
jgi:hypothetical protein